MDSIVNIEALRDAMRKGMKSATLHDWLDDLIEAAEKADIKYGSNYILVEKEKIDEIKKHWNSISNYLVKRIIMEDMRASRYF